MWKERPGPGVVAALVLAMLAAGGLPARAEDSSGPSTGDAAGPSATAAGNSSTGLNDNSFNVRAGMYVQPVELFRRRTYGPAVDFAYWSSSGRGAFEPRIGFRGNGRNYFEMPLDVSGYLLGAGKIVTLFGGGGGGLRYVASRRAGWGLSAFPRAGLILAPDADIHVSLSVEYDFTLPVSGSLPVQLLHTGSLSVGVMF